MQATVTLPTGGRRSLGGFMVVGRGRLKAFDDAALAGIARSGELELIHLHLHSMQNFAGMLKRIGARADAVPAPAGAAPEDGGLGDGAPPVH